jgi:isoleucyl-tRNA synthetase
MDVYDIPNAVKPILPFIEDASNWYVRRSRRRFWKSGDDADKNSAYKTLHYVLVQLSMVLAPFTPFLAEELYYNLTGGESVHLLDWPKTGHINDLLLKEMDTVRGYVNEALAVRAKEGIKVRQPLATLFVPEKGELIDFADILTEELNVHDVKFGEKPALELDLRITDELHREGLMREVIRNVQTARKAAGLNVDDRINLSLVTSDEELLLAISEHKDTIMNETLAKELSDSDEYSHSQQVSVDKKGLTISLQK